VWVSIHAKHCKDVANVSDTPLVMFSPQPLLGLFNPVKAVEPRIAVFAPEGVQEDKSQQWLEGDPVRTPYSIVALTFWAIGHHDGSVPRAVPPR
jgi:hypothetical protein